MDDTKKRGKVIVLEGVNGCGKTTQIKRLGKNMSLAGFSRLSTRNPSDSPVGKLIRDDYLLRNDKNKPDQMLMSLLSATDRYDCVTCKHFNGMTINDMIDEGINIIFDRYYLSSMVHNSDGTEEDMERIFYLNYPSIKKVTPDLTILLDISPGTAVERVNEAGNPRDIYELGERIRRSCELFRHALSMVSNITGIGKFVTIPADGTEEVVERMIWDEVTKLMGGS